MNTIFTFYSFFNSAFNITLYVATVKNKGDREIIKRLALINCVTMSTLHTVSETQFLFHKTMLRTVPGNY